jgi:hypothetical protein
MYFEIMAFWGLLCLVGFAMAELNNRNIVAGVVSAFLLMLLGLTLMSDQIQIKTGETVIGVTNSTNLSPAVHYSLSQSFLKYKCLVNPCILKSSDFGAYSV